ncbi:hypothetical protein RFI_03267 [Reticulomyxa filosa]|uniref:Uncharacterized protein n=1 Tax=Reticulomyxa filosa TaxID=46433 RepID=X6P5K5_RETFI|nr:hypothetical protein RFI_03267 [Reticulomyxa filosa]|eukprot:ETO33835.1 hypothetical protein RFI_03267 [Reticulomyxa filosa]
MDDQVEQRRYIYQHISTPPRTPQSEKRKSPSSNISLESKMESSLKIASPPKFKSRPSRPTQRKDQARRQEQPAKTNKPKVIEQIVKKENCLMKKEINMNRRITKIELGKYYEKIKIEKEEKVKMMKILKPHSSQYQGGLTLIAILAILIYILSLGFALFYGANVAIQKWRQPLPTNIKINNYGIISIDWDGLDSYDKCYYYEDCIKNNIKFIIKNLKKVLIFIIY